MYKWEKKIKFSKSQKNVKKKLLIKDNNSIISPSFNRLKMNKVTNTGHSNSRGLNQKTKKKKKKNDDDVRFKKEEMNINK